MPQRQVMSGWNVKEEGDRGDELIGMVWATTRKERGAFRRNVPSPFRSTPSGPLDRTKFGWRNASPALQEESQTHGYSSQPLVTATCASHGWHHGVLCLWRAAMQL